MRPTRLFVLGCSLGSLVVAQACGGDDSSNVDGSADGAPSDGTVADVNSNPDTGSDTGSDTGTDTGTGGDTGSDTGTGMDAGGGKITQWMCGNATVSDCTQCIGHTQPCVLCNTMDASDLQGSCVQSGTTCGVGGFMAQFQQCPCPTKDASACPEPFQVCYTTGGMFGGSVCLTCGEPAGGFMMNATNGLTCENGGKCDAVDGGCL